MQEDEMKDRPLSVLMGRDSDVIPLLVRIHAPRATSLRVLDVTYGKGTMWKGIREQFDLTTMDKDSEKDVDVVADFADMPFDDNSFEVIVFDPPHLPTNAASQNSSGMWRSRYGITNEKGAGRDGDNVCPMFGAFLDEAQRVMVGDGIILAKIADLVHNHRYQWQHVEFINEVRNRNMTACDLLVKRDPAAGNLKSSKWMTVKHLRKAHCYWIVVRNNRRCEKR